MCPLEKGVRGIETGHQMPGWVRVFATANTWRTQKSHGVSGFGTAATQHSEGVSPKDYQGILRCRAGAGGQGRHRGDGKPGGPDVPP